MISDRLSSLKAPTFSRASGMVLISMGRTKFCILGVGTDCPPARMARPAVLDSFSHFAHINVRLVHISRVVGRYGHGD
jgi:hypothetical protein